MNHFAHLVLSQPTLESAVGNLLGDFARGVDPVSLPPAVWAGLQNHRAVDRFTDAHPRVREMKRGFSRERRRFAGIALDIYFDHLLISHWQEFEQRHLESLIGELYRRMSAGRELMPGEQMKRVTQRMIEYDWFGSYRELDAVAESLDRVAARIRFENRFDNAIEDLQRHHDLICEGFFEFYPELQRHVVELAIESI
ncbi:MAG: ACP phosphodiesterase [Gammaproteobacteria bacterium]|nr:ACP phosphodiesterase [Gammaproteobacteria bacterium]MDH3535977.1 ACP phosphodiesterase [Gammaproteobacteria bacterium]